MVLFFSLENSKNLHAAYFYKKFISGDLQKKVQYTIKLGQTSRCLMHMLKATILVCLSHYALHGFRRLGILQAVWPRFFKIRNSMRVRKIMKTEVPFLSALFLWFQGSFFTFKQKFSNHLLIFMSYQTLHFHPSMQNTKECLKNVSAVFAITMNVNEVQNFRNKFRGTFELISLCCVYTRALNPVC